MILHSSLLARKRKFALLFASLVLFLFLAFAKLIPAWIHNVFALSAVTLMSDTHVSPERELSRLEVLEDVHGAWTNWNQGMPDADSRRHWISVMTRLTEQSNSSVVNGYRIFAEQVRNAENAAPEGDEHEASTLLDQLLLHQPEHSEAHRFKEILTTSDRSGTALLDLKPAYALDFKSENGLHLIGFDLSSAALLLGSSRLPVVFYWTSPEDLTAQDSVVRCGGNADWSWYCYKDRLWVVGTTRNLFNNGTFELAPETESLPFGYRQTYPDSSAILSTQVEYYENKGTSHTIVCMESVTPTRTSLSTAADSVNGSDNFILATHTRYDSSVGPRLGLYWVGTHQQTYSFVPRLPEGTGDWLTISTVLQAPFDVQEIQLRFLYSDSVGELCADHVILFPLHVPEVGER